MHLRRKPTNPQPTGVRQVDASSGRPWTTTAAGQPAPEEGGSPSRSRHRARRWLATALGLALVWSSLGLAGYTWGWQSHKRHSQALLLGSERSAMAKIGARRSSTPCVVTAPQSGQLAGILRIPALHLSAPVEEGTDDRELSVAVGHNPASVWPGISGTAVLLAHDVSYFVHLNQLQPGDKVVYQTACNAVTYTVTGQQVVQQGTPVPDTTSSPTLVLDTCYPPNALFFTTQRLLVNATEDTGSAAHPLGRGLAVPPEDQVTYQVPAPPALVAQGLTLEQNEAPMGTMTLSGETSQGWEQSPGPLALEAAALEAYFGGLHSARQLEPAWWAAIAGPTAPPPGPLLAASITGHDAPLDVEIDSVKGLVSQVILTTTVTISGGSAPGTYHETVVTPVHGSTVRIGSWQLARA